MRRPFTPRRLRFAALALACISAVALPASGGADISARLQARADKLRGEGARLAHQARSVALTLYGLDTRLTRTRGDLSSLRAQARVVRLALASIRTQVDIARRANATAERGLETRLRALYEQGTVEPLEILLGAQTLDGALTGLDALDRLAAQDRGVIDQTRAARRALLALQAKFVRRYTRLAELERSAAASVQSVVAARADRSAYLARLAARRTLTVSEIASLEAQARQAEKRSRQVTPPPASPSGSPTTPPVPSPSGPRALPVTASGYSLGPATATGMSVGWGIVAVDPSVIPLGTRLAIPGYGEGVAADTGSAVRGAAIDLWFPTRVQALAWGRRAVTITIH